MISFRGIATENYSMNYLQCLKGIHYCRIMSTTHRPFNIFKFSHLLNTYLLIWKSIKLSIFSVSVAEVNATTYFKTPFLTLAFPKQLVEYIVMNIEPIAEHERHKFSGQGAISKRVSSNLSTYFLFIFFNRETVTKDWTLAHDWWQLCAQDQGKIKARWLGRKNI